MNILRTYQCLVRMTRENAMIVLKEMLLDLQGPQLAMLDKQYDGCHYLEQSPENDPRYHSQRQFSEPMTYLRLVTV